MKTGSARTTKRAKTARKKGIQSPGVVRLDVTCQWQTSLSDYVTAIVWSPDGQWLGAASAAGEVVLYVADSGVADSGATTSDATTSDATGSGVALPAPAIALRSADGQAVSRLGFSPDGQFVAAAGQAGIVWVWSVPQSLADAPSLEAELHHPKAWIDCLVWHPLKPQVAYAVGSQVYLWHVAEKTKTPLDFQASSVLHLAWHPEGTWLSVSGHEGLKVWSAADWNKAPKAIAVPGASLHSAWSPDGRYLASGNLDRTLTMAEWNCPPPWLMQGFPGKVRQLAWTPLHAERMQLAAACAEGVTIWERKRGQDWTSRVLQHHEGTVAALAFQPQGKFLASAGQDGQVGLWNNGKELAQKLSGFEQGASSLAWRCCGTQLAVGGAAGEIKIWRVAIRQAKGFG